MMRDEDLKQAIDYSEGQKTADEKFASAQHVGPVDVAVFLGITDEEESERIKQDAYQKVHYLVSKLETD